MHTLKHLKMLRRDNMWFIHSFRLCTVCKYKDVVKPFSPENCDASLACNDITTTRNWNQTLNVSAGINISIKCWCLYHLLRRQVVYLRRR